MGHLTVLAAASASKWIEAQERPSVGTYRSRLRPQHLPMRGVDQAVLPA
jgi:hypothetical protein